MIRAQRVVWALAGAVLVMGAAPAVAEQNPAAMRLGGAFDNAGASSGGYGPPPVYVPPVGASQAPPVYVPIVEEPGISHCRDYQTRILVNGRSQLIWGTACRKPEKAPVPAQ